MSIIIKSLANPSVRYVIGWNDDSFRIQQAMSNVSWYETLGDGETQHTGTCAFNNRNMLRDLVNSASAALKVFINTNEYESIKELHTAFRTSFAVDAETAKEAVKVAMATSAGGKKGYIQHREIVKGTKYANLRDCEPLPSLAEDADLHVQAIYKWNLIMNHPNILEVMVAAKMADEGCFPYAQRKLAESWGVTESDMRNLQYAYTDLNGILERMMIVIRFIER